MKTECGLKLYEQVRVVRLTRSPDEYDGWRLNQRLPRVGDVGTLIDVLKAPDLPDRYVVEMRGADGVDIWLSEFERDEIEPITNAT
jgi:hypothetical protein